MKYTLDGSKVLVALNRADFIDISVGDVITIDGFDGVSYKWTEHDRDFMENNPDADLFLQLKREGGNYTASEILLK